MRGLLLLIFASLSLSAEAVLTPKRLERCPETAEKKLLKRFNVYFVGHNAVLELKDCGDVAAVIPESSRGLGAGNYVRFQYTLPGKNCSFLYLYVHNVDLDNVQLRVFFVHDRSLPAAECVVTVNQEKGKVKLRVH